MKTAITDLRGKGRWTAADYARQADLWIVASSWTEKPTKARTLAHLSASYLTWDGQIVGPPGTLNDLIGRTMKALPVTPLWTSADGRQTLMPVDITQRHADAQMADLVTKKMAAFDGVLIDYYVALAFAYPGQFSEDFWLKWDRALRSWVEQMRRLRPDWIFLGQVHQLTEPCGALNGLYNEVDMTSFGASFESHSRDVTQLKSLAALTGREVVYVAELREPARYPLWYQSAYRAWCETNGAYASMGRDAAAQGAA